MRTTPYPTALALFLSAAAATAQKPVPQQAQEPSSAQEPSALEAPTDPVAQTASPPVAPPPPLPGPPAQPAAVSPGVEGQKAAPLSALAIGKKLLGTWQPSALLQFWLYGAREEEETTTTPRIRRAELKVKGDLIADLVKFTVMIDPSKSLFQSRSVEVQGADETPPPTVSVAQPRSDSSILQDFILTFVTDYADISVGGFKNPVSLEGSGSASALLFPERSRVARRFGDRRDLGVKLEKKIGEYFFYDVGVYSGSGINTPDQDNEKDVGVRLEGYPIDGLTVAAVGYTTLGARDEIVRDRLEADLKYDAHNVILQAEYIHAWDGEEANRLEGRGAYGAIGYTLFEKLQPVVRIGFLDTNLDQEEETDSTGGTHYEATLNYYLQGKEARFSLATAVLDRPDQPNLTEVFFLTQLSF